MTAPLAVCVVGRLRSRSAAADGDRPQGLAAASIAVLVECYDDCDVRSSLPALARDPAVPIEAADGDRYRLTTTDAGSTYWRRNLPAESWVVPDV